MSLLSKGFSGVFFSIKGINSLVLCLLYGPDLKTIRDYWEEYSLDHTDLCRQNNVSAFQHGVWSVITFLLRSNCLLISRLQSLSAVVLEPQKRKSVTTSTFSPSICRVVLGPDTMILVFFIFSLMPALLLHPHQESL